MPDDTQDAVAAEYVLGTLSADERDHAEALIAIDPKFAEAVRLWERRLGELNVMVEAVEPPPELWPKIRAEIGEVAPASELPPAPSATTFPQAQTRMPAGNVTLAQSAANIFPASIDEVGQRASELSAVALAPSLEEPSVKPSSQATEAKIERNAEVIDLAQRVTHWRRMTVAISAIAALLAIFIAGLLLAPGFFPFGQPSQMMASSAPGPLGGRLVAVLQHEPMSPAFLLSIDPQSRTLTVRRISATPEAGHSYELWLVSRGTAAPRSLGVVGNDEFTQRAIPSGFDIDTMRSATYAVSLEPAGGSPKATPTGPILFTGKMVESMPAAAPQTPRT